MSENQRHERWKERRSLFLLARKAYPVCDECLEDVMQWEPDFYTNEPVQYYFPATACIICSESTLNPREHGRERLTLDELHYNIDHTEWLLGKAAYPYCQEAANG